MKDYYKILQVEPTATQEEIKKSFRKLAKKFHPDVNKNNPKAEAVFKEMNEAYGILSDETKKAEYDNQRLGQKEQSREYGFQQTDFTNGPNRRKRTQRTAATADFKSTGSIFESFFGFDPKGAGVHINKNDDMVRPMKTNEAYAHIFGKGRFR